MGVDDAQPGKNCYYFFLLLIISFVCRHSFGESYRMGNYDVFDQLYAVKNFMLTWNIRISVVFHMCILSPTYTYIYTYFSKI